MKIKIAIFLLLAIAVRYSLLSLNTFLSLFSGFLFLLFLSSILWTDGSIFKIKSIKSILVNVSLSLAGTLIMFYTNFTKAIFDLIDLFLPTVFSLLWLNYSFFIVILLLVLKLTLVKRKALTTAFVFLISFNVFGEGLFEYRSVSEGTFRMRENKLSFQIEGYPFSCKPKTGTYLPNTFVTLVTGKDSYVISHTILTTQKIEPICLKGIYRNIKELAPGFALIDHNLNSNNYPVILRYKIQKNKAADEQYRELVKEMPSKLRDYAAVAIIFMMIAVFLFLCDVKIKSIKDIFNEKRR